MARNGVDTSSSAREIFEANTWNDSTTKVVVFPTKKQVGRCQVLPHLTS